jgi:hypothetical protein
MATKRSDLDALQATKAQADLHDLLPQELKPCVAQMLEEGPPGGELDPNTTCYVIATEFRRLGKPHERAERELQEWAVRHSARGRSLRYAEVSKTVGRAYDSPDITYGCGEDGPLYRSGLCMGRKTCPYYAKLGAQPKHDELDFYRYGWPVIIGSAAASLYNAIRALEHERGVPGGTTYANYRQLRYRSGCSLSWVRDGLEKLAKNNLIEFVPGKQGSARGEATEIRRVLPIPEPSPDLTPT